jgi:hypothetical protein
MAQRAVVLHFDALAEIALSHLLREAQVFADSLFEQLAPVGLGDLKALNLCEALID